MHHILYISSRNCRKAKRPAGAGTGPHTAFETGTYYHRIKYVADQLSEGIEWLQKVTGRRYEAWSAPGPRRRS